jgi:hypothetical protein
MPGSRPNIYLRPLTAHQTFSRALGKELHAPRLLRPCPGAFSSCKGDLRVLDAGQCRGSSPSLSARRQHPRELFGTPSALDHGGVDTLAEVDGDALDVRRPSAAYGILWRAGAAVMVQVRGDYAQLESRQAGECP